MKPEQLVLVALGSNLGDSLQILNDAIVRLKHFASSPLVTSSIWETAPVDCPPGSPNFLNAVVGFEPVPGTTPQSLLENLQALEQEFGRRPKVLSNEPRPLDLDLIAFGRQVLTSERLILPHPRAHLRRFVLAPLSEIAAHLRLPGQSQTVRELLDALPEQPAAARRKDIFG